MKNNMLRNNLLLLVLLAVFIVLPLIMANGAAFEGADGQAEEAIMQINPHYEPWFSSIWEPPSGEIESLLFALQGALGAGFICYYLGYMKGSKKSERD
ncbi:cobalt/nickel transport protein [Desulfallas thermosapovorans DSM 6562]|uniref:Cobalt transport protein CbiN n=2 Tax=Desulfallas thermosapovorans TaxID=58137 RepID=A0A5S4ZVI1_9FIRM|nr:cobalt/nickel transport protein [Desulfallas thermosapovorans DSM 6562]